MRHVRNYVKRPMWVPPPGEQTSATMEVSRIMPSPHAPRVTPGISHQRMDGLASVRFGQRGLADLYQRAPCRMLFLAPPRGAWPEAVSLTTSGGLTGGDRVRVELEIDPGARATITTQAAEKLYRVLPGEPDILLETRITIGAGGSAEWLAQEAIAFDATRLRRSISAELAGDARLLAVESLVLGRLAMGERFARGLIHDEWRVRRDGRLVWADALHVDTAELPALDDRFRFGGARAVATLLYAGPDAARYLDLARSLLPTSAGATSFDGLLIARFHDADPARLRADLTRSCGALRAGIFGNDPAMPRVWSC